MLVQRLAPYVGGLALVLLLMSQIEMSHVAGHLRRADPRWLLVGCGWYLATNLLRAFRFGALLKLSSWRSIMAILPEMFALSFLNNVLPSRTGELSFPYFMQRRHQVTLGESATALLIARIFDYLAVISLYLVFSLFELPNLTEGAAQIIGWVIAIAGVSVLLLAIAPWISSVILRFIEGWLIRLTWHQNRFIKSLLSFSHEAVAALTRTRRLTIYFCTFGWSVAIWLSTFAWFAAFLNAIGLSIRYTLVVVGATFASLAKAIPFVTIGGFGAHEAGWTLGFSLTGMEPTLAISSGFAVNILTLIMSVLFGGLALLFIAWGARSRSG